MEYGVHTIVAFTYDGQTSVTPVEVSLTPGQPTTSAVIELHRRPLRVHVTGPTGLPIDTAIVRTQLANVPGEGGDFDAEKTPAGMELMIRAIGYLPSCQFAAATPEQMIVLQPVAKSRVHMALMPEQSRPIGTIHGVPGSNCDVDVAMFRLDQSVEQVAGQLRFDILGLPKGNFTFRASPTAQPLELRVPDEKLNHYAVPPGCMVCG